MAHAPRLLAMRQPRDGLRRRPAAYRQARFPGHVTPSSLAARHSPPGRRWVIDTTGAARADTRRRVMGGTSAWPGDPAADRQPGATGRRALQALKRAELRKEDVALIADRDDRRLRAVAGQDQPQLRQLGVTVLRHQQIHLQPATALAAGARDLEHRDPGDKIAERNRAVSHGPTGPSSARCTR